MMDVASDGTNWVAVGGAGTVLVSPDGTNWAVAAKGLLPTNRSLREVTHGAGRWVAVGDVGAIATSADGAHWTLCTPVTTESLQGVTYGKGRFLAVGSYGAVASSENGIDWKLETTPNPWASSFQSVVCANGLFLAGGLSGVQTSTDGVEWVPQQIPDAHDVFSVWHDGEQFLAGRFNGLILTSPDATNWVARGGFSAPYINKLTKRGNMWLAAAGELWQSQDLTNWTTVDTGAYASTSGGGISSAHAGAGGVVVVGEAGNVLVSADGTNFLQCRQGRPLTFGPAVVCRGGRRVVLSVAGAALTSEDGWTWTEREFGAPSFSARDAYYDQTQIVAVGAYLSSSGIGLNEIRTSPDGIVWTSHRLASQGGLFGITRTSGEYVVVGAGGLVLRSSDGVAWASFLMSGKLRLSSVAWGGGKLVVVGPANTSYVSDGGNDWTPVPSGTSFQLASVAHGAGRFVAVGQRGAVVWSGDGAAWNPASAGVSVDLRRVSYRDNRFVVVGAGPTLISPDGVSWSELSGAPSDLRGIDWDAAGFLATGERAIFNSGPPRLRMEVQKGDAVGVLRLGLRSQAGEIVRLEMSPALTDWSASEVFTNLLGFQWLEVTNAGPTGFYRLRGEASP